MKRQGTPLLDGCRLLGIDVLELEEQRPRGWALWNRDPHSVLDAWRVDG
jgi:hypothetical protein